MGGTGATERGLLVDQVVTEVGFGMNGRRRKLTRLLSDPAVSVLVVEYRDRLTGFGFEHLAAALAAGLWSSTSGKPATTWCAT